MTSSRAPAWLEEFQARFGAVIRTPLDRSTGTLRATPGRYDASIEAEARDAHNASASERLAVYNRQYWFRLFGVLQTAFPLTTRLFGHWSFNELAARFLLESPPRGWDLDHAPDGFEVWLRDAASSGPITHDVVTEAALEAATIDAAWRLVFRAPDLAPFRFSPEDGARLVQARLVRSPAVAFVEEHWPLVDLRQTFLGQESDESEARVPLPPPLPRSRWWAFLRRPNGIARLPLEPREAELLVSFEEHVVGVALGRLEVACTEDERARLPQRTREWLARSVQLGFWSGVK